MEREQIERYAKDDVVDLQRRCFVNTHANPFPGNLVIIKDSYSYSAYSYIANVYFTSDVDGKERTGSLNELDKIGLNKIREQVCMMIEILIIVNVAIM